MENTLEKKPGSKSDLFCAWQRIIDRWHGLERQDIHLECDYIFWIFFDLPPGIKCRAIQ